MVSPGFMSALLPSSKTLVKNPWGRSGSADTWGRSAGADTWGRSAGADTWGRSGLWGALARSGLWGPAGGGTGTDFAAGGGTGTDFAAGGGWLGRRELDFSADLTDVIGGSNTFALRSALLETHFRARGYSDITTGGGTFIVVGGGTIIAAGGAPDTSRNLLFLQTLGPWFPNEMQNLLSSEKRTLDHWATVQFLFSTAQVRCFWCCLWFRSGLVALFLKTSKMCFLVNTLFLSDSWRTDSSFSPLLVKLSQVFESALLDCILKLAVIPVACAPFPTQILPSSQLCWYICFDTALIQHSVWLYSTL